MEIIKFPKNLPPDILLEVLCFDTRKITEENREVSKYWNAFVTIYSDRLPLHKERNFVVSFESMGEYCISDSYKTLFYIDSIDDSEECKERFRALNYCYFENFV